MGYFHDINLSYYRNFLKASYIFDKGCNVIIGKNGSGKTNILEGISLFEKGRGFRKDKIYNLINFNNSDKDFNIKSIFKNQKIDFDINVYNSTNNVKKISINGSADRDSIKHFNSLFSIIYFLPEMERLFLSSPSLRRNFIDRLIYTFYKEYNIIINNYKKVVSERQSLLKNASYDENWIKKLEAAIVDYGSIIYKKRTEYIKILNSLLNELDIIENFSNKFYLRIEDKFLQSSYDIHENPEVYLNELKKNRKIDFLSGSCSIGPHRSDVTGFKLNDNFNINQFSTGQQKTSIILIIIAQCKYLIKTLNLHPIILLDEVCSHLDENNRELLLYLIDELKVQVFMTGTEKYLFSFLSTKANYCNIN